LDLEASISHPQPAGAEDAGFEEAETSNFYLSVEKEKIINGV
jgi:hypothetical protein